MGEIKIHDTMSGQIRPFETGEKGKAYVYVCGITPYDYCHMGHARTLVSFDIIRRWMLHGGIEVTYIQNVTDIDDKIIRRAKEKKQKPLELSAHFDKLSREDMDSLGIMQPTHMPKISEHIPQTIGLIKKIIQNRHAYVTKSGVYFDISTFENYGRLSRQNIEKMRAGARVEVDEGKKNPEDFALWKLEETEGATYDSPWGRGRPGWHIECSAMSLYYTDGKPLDLHGGARDLIFPHHENEIAQSEGAGVVPFSRHWAHTGFLTVNGEKMAKSLGNFITIRDALKKWEGNAMRMFFALTHYRSPIDFSEDALNAAKNTLDNVRRSLMLMEGEGAAKIDAISDKALEELVLERLALFEKHMDNDIDTPQALAALIEASKIIARARAEGKCHRKIMEKHAGAIIEAFAALGIDARGGQAMGEGDGRGAKASISADEVEKLISEREIARKKKDFKTSDEIRKKLAGLGVVIEDSKDGVRWKIA